MSSVLPIRTTKPTLRAIPGGKSGNVTPIRSNPPPTAPRSAPVSGYGGAQGAYQQLAGLGSMGVGMAQNHYDTLAAYDKWAAQLSPQEKAGLQRFEDAVNRDGIRSAKEQDAGRYLDDLTGRGYDLGDLAGLPQSEVDGLADAYRNGDPFKMRPSGIGSLKDLAKDVAAEKAARRAFDKNQDKAKGRPDRDNPNDATDPNNQQPPNPDDPEDSGNQDPMGQWTISVQSVGQPLITRTYGGRRSETPNFRATPHSEGRTNLTLFIGDRAVELWTTWAEQTRPVMTGSAFQADPDQPKDPKPKPPEKPKPNPDPEDVPRPIPDPSPSPVPSPARRPGTSPAPTPARPSSPSDRPDLPLLPRIPTSPSLPLIPRSVPNPNPGGQNKPLTPNHPRTTVINGSASPFKSKSTKTSSDTSPGSDPSPEPSPSCRYREDDLAATTVTTVQIVGPQRSRVEKPLQVHEELVDYAKESFEQLAKIREGIDRLEKNSKVQRVMGIIQTATMIHNAAMLTRSLADTLVDATSLTVTAVARWIGVLDPEQSIDFQEIIGQQVQQFLKSVLGDEVYNDVSEKWKSASRIYQASANIVHTLNSMSDATRDILETTADNTGKIGNALRKSGVIAENSYGWMNENNNAGNKRQRFFEKVNERLENLENATSMISSVSGNVVSIQDDFDQFNKQREELRKAYEDAAPKLNPLENKPIKATAEASKSVSLGKDITIADLEKPDDTP